MKTYLLKSILLGVTICGLSCIHATVQAQTTNKSAFEKKAAADKKDASAKTPLAHPFHGKLAAIDKNAKSITLGKSTYYISAETKIKKADKPAALDDGVIGEPVSGYAKPAPDGKMVASSVHFGPKSEAATPGKKKSAENKK